MSVTVRSGEPRGWCPIPPRPRPGDAVSIKVLANDSEPSGNPLTVTATTRPSNGTATVSGDRKSITYRPDNGFSGSDAFRYTASDGRGATAEGSVVVTVRERLRTATTPVNVTADATPYDDASCDSDALDGTLYHHAELGPRLAVDPTAAGNLIAVWQQDRYVQWRSARQRWCL